MDTNGIPGQGRGLLGLGERREAARDRTEVRVGGWAAVGPTRLRRLRPYRIPHFAPVG
ncbi:hypothetical protein [Microbacterium hominis]|uniref:Uncharacterized protein n=1 Tax=Microbacterium hominis TaxID=162426 RepID=A0A7D4Q6I4_9MICO|nr:hypothetical protein [Microbacterium hominis]QKJ18239.1 hypothetical protein HQM25_01695 [Microbacterium hominis]